MDWLWRITQTGRPTCPFCNPEDAGDRPRAHWRPWGNAGPALCNIRRHLAGDAPDHLPPPPAGAPTCPTPRLRAQVLSKCPLCGHGEDSVQHLLLYCPLVSAAHRSLKLPREGWDASPEVLATRAHLWRQIRLEILSARQAGEDARQPHACLLYPSDAAADPTRSR